MSSLLASLFFKACIISIHDRLGTKLFLVNFWGDTHPKPRSYTLQYSPRKQGLGVYNELTFTTCIKEALICENKVMTTVSPVRVRDSSVLGKHEIPNREHVCSDSIVGVGSWAWPPYRREHNRKER